MREWERCAYISHPSLECSVSRSGSPICFFEDTYSPLSGVAIFKFPMAALWVANHSPLFFGSRYFLHYNKGPCSCPWYVASSMNCTYCDRVRDIDLSTKNALGHGDTSQNMSIMLQRLWKWSTGVKTALNSHLCLNIVRVLRLQIYVYACIRNEAKCL